MMGSCGGCSVSVKGHSIRLTHRKHVQIPPEHACCVVHAEAVPCKVLPVAINRFSYCPCLYRSASTDLG